MESSEHRLYSFRHAFEQRMKVAGVGDELRMYLMGHAIDRPQYGYSDVLNWSSSAMEKVSFDQLN